MLARLLESIGLAGVLTDRWDTVGLAAHHEAALWAAAILLIPVAYLVWRRQRRHLAAGRTALTIALCAARLTIFILLMMVLADPYLTLDRRSEQKPVVAVLVDESDSMRLPLDDSSGISRLKHIEEVLRAPGGGVLQHLAERFDVRFYAFARDLKPLAIDLGDVRLPQERRDGADATRLGDAVLGVLDQTAGRRLAGIVAISDGENTGGRALANAGRAAASAAAPVFAVPAGPQTRRTDVAVVDVFTTGLVAVGDTVLVAATIESKGFDGRPVKVELRDGKTLLDTKELILRSAEQQQVELSLQAAEPGVRVLTVSVPRQPEEVPALHANNSETALLRVSGEKLRVLYVEGRPRWDYRYLRNAMHRDRALAGRQSAEPDIVLEAEWRRRPAEWPALPRTLEELSAYHTIILGDASPQILTSEFIGLLAQAVRERGVGLLIEAGPASMPHAFDRRLLDLLPIRIQAGVPGLDASPNRPFRVELSPQGALNEALRFHADPVRNQDLWAHMPAFHWCVAAERSGPAASVLAWNSGVRNNYGKLPLIASQYAGRGKVMLVGTDSTWTWRENAGDRYFYKFWGQAIRFVARRQGDSANEARAEAPPIMPTDRELRHPDVDRAALQVLASASGGRLVELPDLATIVNELKGEAKTIAVHREVSLWDNWLVLIVIALVYCLDIGARRLAGLS
jgi:hypothetical protein